MENFLFSLLAIANECNLSFDEVFSIAYDYGFVDAFGNVTTEVLEHKKGND